MEKRKVIIDCDPGIDDAFALVAALSSQNIEILGITTVAGNNGLEAVTKNMLRIKKLMKSPVKIYVGKDSQLPNHRDATKVHGGDGMGNSGLLFDERELEQESAVDFIIDSMKKYPNEIDLIALGPLTNLAQAIDKDYEAMKLIKSIYMMGGGIDRGNVTPYAEFNFWVNAEATANVFDLLAEHTEIHMMPLDACHQTLLNLNDIYFLQQECGEIGESLAHMCQQYVKAYYAMNGYFGAVIHDLILVLYYLNPALISEVKEEPIIIITEGEKIGQTVIDENGKKVKIAWKLNNFDWKNELIELVFPNVFERWKEVMHIE